MLPQQGNKKNFRRAGRQAVVAGLRFRLGVFCGLAALSFPTTLAYAASPTLQSQQALPAQAPASTPTPDARPAATPQPFSPQPFSTKAQPTPQGQTASDSQPVHPAPVAPEAAPPLYDDIVVTAVGDVMLGSTFPDDSGGDLPPHDGAGLLDEVTPILKHGDIVFGNLEGPLVDGGVSPKCRGKKAGTCYAFRVPTRYGAYLKSAGFTVMGLANNHAMDFGAEGRASSRRVLEGQGIAHSGEVGDIARLTVKGRKIDVIAFATYPGAYNLLDLSEALNEIRKARAESDLVIVSFHGGAEGAPHQHVAPADEKFLGEDRGDLRKFAHAAVDAGAQLVLGSGPHVVRGMEVYHGILIAYSLGNFATYGSFNLTGENGIALVLESRLAPDGTFLSGQVYPIKQEKPGGPKLDPAMSIVPIVRALSRTDFRGSAVVVGPRGELWLPGTRIPECSDAPDLLDEPAGARPCGIFP